MSLITAELESGQRVRLDNGRHQWYADELEIDGGSDTAPSPYELLLGSLAACTAITLRLYAQHKNIAIDSVRLEYNHYKAGVPAEAPALTDAEPSPFADIDEAIERITATVTISGALTEAQRARLLQVVSRCPVHKTLNSGIKIVDHVVFSDEVAVA